MHDRDMHILISGIVIFDCGLHCRQRRPEQGPSYARDVIACFDFILVLL